MEGRKGMEGKEGREGTEGREGRWRRARAEETRKEHVPTPPELLALAARGRPEKPQEDPARRSEARRPNTAQTLRNGIRALTKILVATHAPFMQGKEDACATGKEAGLVATECNCALAKASGPAKETYAANIGRAKAE